MPLLSVDVMALHVPPPYQPLLVKHALLLSLSLSLSPSCAKAVSKNLLPFVR